MELEIGQRVRIKNVNADDLKWQNGLDGVLETIYPNGGNRYVVRLFNDPYGNMPRCYSPEHLQASDPIETLIEAVDEY